MVDVNRAAAGWPSRWCPCVVLFPPMLVGPFGSSHYSSVPGTSISVFFSTEIKVNFHKNRKVIPFLLSPQ